MSEIGACASRVPVCCVAWRCCSARRCDRIGRRELERIGTCAARPGRMRLFDPPMRRLAFQNKDDGALLPSPAR